MLSNIKSLPEGSTDAGDVRITSLFADNLVSREKQRSIMLNNINRTVSCFISLVLKK